ncbi:helix-turn-helix transcriptional regulator [Streptomyces sp. NPDC001941]|uniref:helix-turn-helix domain-containing protein n=1 Tax=Streptomyces sp. NPDC001941 TaxID=3154659 RepID=UPI00331B1C50
MGQRPRDLDDTLSPRHWFGVEVRNWRTLRALTTAELGRILHVSASLIERVEKAERSCSLALATQLDARLHTGGALLRLWHRTCAPHLHADTPALRHPDTQRNPTAALRATPAASSLASWTVRVGTTTLTISVNATIDPHHGTPNSATLPA